MRREKKERLSKSAASGMVALVFLVLGFQLAIFVVKVIERPRCPVKPGMTSGLDVTSEPGVTAASEAAGDARSREPFFGERDERQSSAASETTGRSKYGGYERPSKSYGGKPKPAEKPRRKVESFAFDPNTVTLKDLQRLGLTERQAETIENYRSKGGHFRSKVDFQKMYVVSDTLFARLEPYIEIPKLELNDADSAALVTLHGIGPWYAHKILAYRERLGGFCDKEQLLEIEGMDRERYEGFAEDVTADPSKIRPLDLWHAPDSILARHPYLGPKGARSIVRYREIYDSTRWTPADLARERALSQENIEKLKKYIDIQ